MRELAYLGLDAHSRHCVLGGRGVRDTFLFCQRFRTRESEVISQVL